MGRPLPGTFVTYPTWITPQDKVYPRAGFRRAGAGIGVWADRTLELASGGHYVPPAFKARARHVRSGGPLGDRLTVGQRTLTPPV